MKENSIYDKKSIRTVMGKTADFDELAKDCVAFSNAEGGRIDIGIEDEEKLPPIGQRVPDGLPTTIINKITGKTHGVILSANVLAADNGSEYIELSIACNHNLVAMTTSGKVYIRIGDNSVPVGPEDFARLAADKGSLTWENVKTKYSWHDADPDKLQWFLKVIRKSGRVSSFVKQKEDKELLDYFYMTDEDTDAMTQLGVLFLGKQTQRGRIMNPPVIQVIKYDHYGEKVNKWLWDDYSKNPYEMIDELWQTIPEWTESKEIADGMFRRNIPAYSEKVVRELLANSLVHRPYTVRGDIFINIYPEYIEVVNPGRLPMGVTADNILHTSKKRNEHLCNVFYALYLMEREGSGYDMMYENLLENGKAVPQVEEGDDYVKVTVSRRVLSEETIKVMTRAAETQLLKQKQLICLGMIASAESLTGTQLIKKLSLKNGDALRSWLHPLIDKGMVVATDDHSKAKEYRVAPELLRNSQFKGKTTLKRIEPYRIKELILEDLKIYRISSIQEIQERIGKEISIRKIRIQLNTLINEGKVKKVGSNRWLKFEYVNS